MSFVNPNPQHQALYDAARRRVMKPKRKKGFAMAPQPKTPRFGFGKQQSY